METFFLKLAVAVIPLIVLVVSITIISDITSCPARRSLVWHRRRRTILRTLAGGVVQRH